MSNVRCEIKKGINGKYSAWVHGFVSSRGKVLCPLIIVKGLYQVGWDDYEPDIEFDTEQEAVSAYDDYRKRNPCPISTRLETVKEIFY